MLFVCSLSIISAVFWFTSQAICFNKLLIFVMYNDNMLLLSVSYNIYKYMYIFLLCTTVQYCNRIIILYVTDIFIVTLLQFFLDFVIIFKMSLQC